MGSYAAHFMSDWYYHCVVFLFVFLKSEAAQSWVHDIDCEVTSTTSPDWSKMSCQGKKLGYFDVNFGVDDDNEEGEGGMFLNTESSAKPETVISSVWIAAGDTANTKCPVGYEKRCWWGVDSGHSTSGQRGDYAIALCLQRQPFQYGLKAVSDVIVIASKKPCCPLTPVGYERRGYWAPYGYSYSYYDDSSGHITMAIYTKSDEIKCHKCGESEYISRKCSGSTDTECARCSDDTKCAEGVWYYYGVGLDKAVYRHSSDGGSSWQKLTVGAVTQVEVANNIIYGIGLDKAIYKWTGLSWTKITTGSVTRFVISGNDIYGLGLDKAIWKSSVDGAKWIRITSGSVTDFALFKGYFYGVGTNKVVYKHSSDGKGNWQRVTGGSVTQVKVVDEIIYGLGLDRAIWKWIGNSWTRVTTGSVTSFDISGNDIHGVGPDRAIWKSSVYGAKWTRITGGSVTDIVHTLVI